jgi:DNA-directed RNA polymerase subunit RPC12/RpoP
MHNDTVKPNTKLIVLPADMKVSCPECGFGFTLTKAALLTVHRDTPTQVGYKCSQCKVPMQVEEINAVVA